MPLYLLRPIVIAGDGPRKMKDDYFDQADPKLIQSSSNMKKLVHTRSLCVTWQLFGLYSDR
jgi:hypothetical protein